MYDIYESQLTNMSMVICNLRYFVPAPKCRPLPGTPGFILLQGWCPMLHLRIRVYSPGGPASPAESLVEGNAFGICPSGPVELRSETDTTLRSKQRLKV